MPESDTKAPEASNPTPRATPDGSPGSFRRFLSQLWRLIKILIVLAVVAGIGLAIYYGWPIVNEKYLNPIASNSVGVQTADARLDATDTRLADLEATVATLSAAEADLPGRLETIEATIESLTADQDRLTTRLGTITTQIKSHTDRLNALDTVQAELAAAVTEGENETIRQVELLRAMELLSRARLFLFQANYGLAEADVQTARTVLAGVQTGYPDWKPSVMVEVLFRVDRTLTALPLLPVPAADDLDIAWQVLLTQVAPTDAAAPLDATKAPTDDTTTTTTTTTPAVGTDG